MKVFSNTEVTVLTSALTILKDNHELITNLRHEIKNTDEMHPEVDLEDLGTFRESCKQAGDALYGVLIVAGIHFKDDESNKAMDRLIPSEPSDSSD